MPAAARMEKRTIIKTDKLVVAAALLTNGMAELLRAERTDEGHLFHLRTSLSEDDVKQTLIEYERTAKKSLDEVFNEMDADLQRTLLTAIQLKKAVGRICY